MNTATLTMLISSSSLSARTCLPRRWMMGRNHGARSAPFSRWIAPTAAGLFAAGLIAPSYADDTYADNAARLEQMTPDQKEDLSRKKLRFDELSAAEKQRLRDLHVSITTDPNAKELSDTVTRYTRWLANLDPADRSTLLDIKDPEQRIARIKE